MSFSQCQVVSDQEVFVACVHRLVGKSSMTSTSIVVSLWICDALRQSIPAASFTVFTGITGTVHNMA